MNIREKTKKTSEENYYAFFDAEYTCYMRNDTLFDKNHNSEVISVGLVITDHKFRVKKTFYSVIRPKYNPVLTGYCKSLTGLKQREIDRAPDYDTVFQKMFKLFQKYPVKEIFVWGSDHHTLEDDILKNHTSVAKNHKRIVHKVKDITKRVTMQVFGKAITVGLADMKYICGRKREVAHNALEDAKDLYFIYKTVTEGKYNKERAAALLQFVEDRDCYHRYRRFKLSHRKEEMRQITHSPKEKALFQECTKSYIEELKKFSKAGEKTAPQIAALCDDLRVIADMEAKDYPELD